MTGHRRNPHFAIRGRQSLCHFPLFTGYHVEEYRRQLGSFGISGELAMRSVESLSGGQKSRVAFAMLNMAT